MGTVQGSRVPAMSGGTMSFRADYSWRYDDSARMAYVTVRYIINYPYEYDFRWGPHNRGSTELRVGNWILKNQNLPYVGNGGDYTIYTAPEQGVPYPQSGGQASIYVYGYMSAYGIKEYEKGSWTGKTFNLEVSLSGNAVTDRSLPPAFVKPRLNLTIKDSSGRTLNGTAFNANHQFYVSWDADYSQNNSATYSDNYVVINGTPTNPKVYINSPNAGTSGYMTMSSYVPISQQSTTANKKLDATRTVSGGGVSLSTLAEVSFGTIYTPTKAPTSITLNNVSDGTIISPTAPKPDISIRVVYPASYNAGIVNGYRVQLIDVATGSIKSTTYQNTTSTDYTFNFPKGNYLAGVRYKFRIAAMYNNSNVGPTRDSSIFSVTTKLPAPIISYPLSNGAWINNPSNLIYVLFTLPADSDYSDIGAGANYKYADIGVMINGVEYTYTSHPNNFSVSNLSYQRRVVFTTKGMPLGSVSGYRIQIRVKKNYGSSPWSDYTAVRSINVVALSKRTMAQNTPIMIEDYNSAASVAKSMRQCYLSSGSAVTIKDIARNTVIYRDDYQRIYNDLTAIVTLINEWGSYDKAAVKCPTLPAFVPQVEVITADVVANYIKKAYSWIENFN